MKILNKLAPILISIYILITVIIGSSYIFNNSIRFDADISRDFLILDEIQTKKFVFIGPRASGIPGVFHGPLWIYLNLPAYLLGNANPVVVGYGWIVLILVFIFSSYILIKAISNKNTSLIFLILISGVLIPWYHQLLNPFGAFALIPLLMYLLIKYFQKHSKLLLSFILLTLGCMIQFQMAVGGPISLLVFGLLINKVIKSKQYSDFLIFPIFAIPLTSFIIFELRHDFAQLNAVINFLTNKTEIQQTSIITRLLQRVIIMSQHSISLFYDKYLFLNIIVFISFIFQRITNYFKLNKNERLIFNTTFYLYVGYFLISLLFNGTLLIYYWWPLVPLSILMSSLILSKIKTNYLLIILMILIYSQLSYGIKYMRDANNNIGVREDDWKFQINLVENLFDGDEEEFGYFIFTPDVYGYESKAAMIYAIKNHPKKNVIKYSKQPVTYLILAPRDMIREDVNSNVWKDQRLNLDPKLVANRTIEYNDGYIIEKWLFNDELINQDPDPTIDDWLHFR